MLIKYIESPCEDLFCPLYLSDVYRPWPTCDAEWKTANTCTTGSSSSGAFGDHFIRRCSSSGAASPHEYSGRAGSGGAALGVTFGAGGYSVLTRLLLQFSLSIFFLNADVLVLWKFDWSVLVQVCHGHCRLDCALACFCGCGRLCFELGSLDESGGTWAAFLRATPPPIFKATTKSQQYKFRQPHIRY